MLHPSEFICPLCGQVLDNRRAFHQHVTKNREPTSDAKLAAITFPIVGFVTWFLYNIWPGGAGVFGQTAGCIGVGIKY